MSCSTGWVFGHTETEVFVQLLESAELRTAYSWPSLVPSWIREEGCGHIGLCYHFVEGEPQPWSGGSVSPSREVMPSHEVVVASLPTPLLRAGLCFVSQQSKLGLWASIFREPLLRNLRSHCSWPVTPWHAWDKENILQRAYSAKIVKQKDLPAWDITFESMSPWTRGKPRVWAVYFCGEWGLTF